MSAQNPKQKPDGAIRAPCRYYEADPRLLARDNNVGLLIKQVHSLLHRVIDHKAAPLELTAIQWRPLMLIHHQGIDTPA
ncbi:MAG TPA: MarR family transcriptional regulator, partial [Castellaniella sp.]|nr:MarR family transcriptional regulator [Castellaniella sp.]